MGWDEGRWYHINLRPNSPSIRNCCHCMCILRIIHHSRSNRINRVNDPLSFGAGAYFCLIFRNWSFTIPLHCLAASLARSRRSLTIGSLHAVMLQNHRWWFDLSAWLLGLFWRRSWGHGRTMKNWHQNLIVYRHRSWRIDWWDTAIISFPHQNPNWNPDFINRHLLFGKAASGCLPSAIIDPEGGRVYGNLVSEGCFECRIVCWGGS